MFVYIVKTFCSYGELNSQFVLGEDEANRLACANVRCYIKEHSDYSVAIERVLLVSHSFIDYMDQAY